MWNRNEYEWSADATDEHVSQINLFSITSIKRVEVGTLISDERFANVTEETNTSCDKTCIHVSNARRNV